MPPDVSPSLCPPQLVLWGRERDDKLDGDDPEHIRWICEKVHGPSPPFSSFLLLGTALDPNSHLLFLTGVGARHGVWH